MKVILQLLLRVLLPLWLIYMLFGLGYLPGFAGVAAYAAVIFFTGRGYAYAYLGNVSYAKKDKAKAMDWFKKAYETGRAGEKNQLAYGYLLLKSGRMEEAETILKKLSSAGANENTRFLAQSNMALVLWKKGEIEAAVNLLQNIITAYQTTTIYGSLGYLLTLRDDLDEALRFNLKAYEYNQADPVIQDNLGHTYYRRGEWDQAQEVYDTLLQQNPAFPEAYYNYGLVLEAQGQLVGAAEAMEKALTYEFSFLSTVTPEEIRQRLAAVKDAIAAQSSRPQE